MIKRSYKKIALIPAYQPDETLINTVTELHKKGFRIVITDDGSGPDYVHIFEQVKKYSAFLSYPVNHGKGYAIKTGIHYIQRKLNDNYVIVTVDANGRYSADDALTAAEIAADNTECLIIGAGKREKSESLKNKLKSKVTKHVFSTVTGTSINDTLSGLRAFSCDIAEYIRAVRGSRYEYEINMLMQCTKDNISIIEFPVKPIKFEDSRGSYFDSVKDSAKICKAIFEFKKIKNH